MQCPLESFSFEISFLSNLSLLQASLSHETFPCFFRGNPIYLSTDFSSLYLFWRRKVSKLEFSIPLNDERSHIFYLDGAHVQGCFQTDIRIVISGKKKKKLGVLLISTMLVGSFRVAFSYVTLNNCCCYCDNFLCLSMPR